MLSTKYNAVQVNDFEAFFKHEGFGECSFSAFTIAASVSCIGVHALAHAQMPLVIFEASSISEISGFQHAVVSVFCIPSPPTCRIPLLGVFIDYPTAILPMCRRGAITRSHAGLPPTRPHFPLPVSSPFHDLPELWHAGCIDYTFASSLFISVRRGDASSFSVLRMNPGRTHYFQSVT
jgi:hypothetical protein